MSLQVVLYLSYGRHFVQGSLFSARRLCVFPWKNTHNLSQIVQFPGY